MKSIHILLVEDNEGDIILTTEAFEHSKLVNKISVTRNGKEALDFLFKRNEFEQETSPDLILLDVNLPLKNGHEVLQTIKVNEKTKHIPVIMLTTSSSEDDIMLSYRNHVNCYITKPVDVASFLSAVTSIEDFWANVVSLPSTIS